MFNLNESKIIKLMEELIKRNGSDLHLTEDTIPYFRVQGQIMPAESFPISSKILKEDPPFCSFSSYKNQLHNNLYHYNLKCLI